MIIQFTIFIFVSSILIFLCYKQLSNLRCHGFYRFFSFEFLLILALLNVNFKELEVFSLLSIISGLFLFLSLVVVVFSVYQLQQSGLQKRENMPENFCFENTRELITKSIYRYIRHPMYLSLLLLGCGLYLQNPSILSVVVLSLAVFFIGLTVRAEEKENMLFFGEQYREYQKNNKMLIPFLL